jgi:hypothetical protein
MYACIYKETMNDNQLLDKHNITSNESFDTTAKSEIHYTQV